MQQAPLTFTLREAWQKERRESEAYFVKEASKQKGAVLLEAVSCSCCFERGSESSQPAMLMT